MQIKTLPLVFIDRKEQSVKSYKTLLAELRKAKENTNYSSKPITYAWLHKALVRLIIYISKKRQKLSLIGKKTEGFIAYITWARPPSMVQLVKNFVFIDKLSHKSFYSGDITWL